MCVFLVRVIIISRSLELHKYNYIQMKQQSKEQTQEQIQMKQQSKEQTQEQIQMKQQSKEQTQEQIQIQLINELCRLQHNFKEAKKTIILYDFYSTLEADSVYLHNLHTIAQVLLDNGLKVVVQEIKVGYKAYFDKLTVQPGQDQKIISTTFQVEEGVNSLNNIVLYQTETAELRIVVIPIQKDLADISKLKEEQEKLEEEDKDQKKRFSDANLQYGALTEAQNKWNIEKDQKFRQNCELAKDKHLKMFKIQAFVGTILQKTETYSICFLAEMTMRRYKKISQYIASDFKKIFSVPQGANPQCIFYNYDSSAPSAQEANHQLVTTRLQSEKGQFKIGKIDCFNSQHFHKPERVRTKIYQNMQNSNNKAIDKVIQDFVDNWNKITVDTASCIATVVKLVSQHLNREKRLATQDVNQSFSDIYSQTQLSSGLTFPNAFELYISPSLWFPQNVKLQEFYTNQRLGQKLKIEKGYPKIPSSIQCLTFIHFFNRLILDFTEKYRQTEMLSKNDQIILLKQWKDNLKELYELVNAINKTFLNTSQNQDLFCQNMQRYFDFLMFAFDSSQKIKKITGRDISTASTLKSLFEKFKPKKDSLLSFIISNQRSIKSDEPIHYYDLYLLVIRQNASQDIQNDLEYIQLHIHELKASRIATQYLWDHQRLVQAINSYALIALKYDTLNQKKRDLIDILQIQKRMARLLKIVGQEQFAADIYFKNRDLHFANNCCKQVLSKYKGESKVAMLIRWGEKFQKEFEYDLAGNYYMMAFSHAKSASEKKKAMQKKMLLVEKRGTVPSADDRSKHDKFIKDQNLIEFCSETKLTDSYTKLSKYLVWDALLKCAIINKPCISQKDLQSSPAKSFQTLEMSPIPAKE